MDRITYEVENNVQQISDLLDIQIELNLLEQKCPFDDITIEIANGKDKIESLERYLKKHNIEGLFKEYKLLEEEIFDDLNYVSEKYDQTKRIILDEVKTDFEEISIITMLKFEALIEKDYDKYFEKQDEHGCLVKNLGSKIDSIVVEDKDYLSEIVIEANGKAKFALYIILSLMITIIVLAIILCYILKEIYRINNGNRKYRKRKI